MKRTILSALAAILCLAASAQSATQIIEENPYRAANNLHSYEFSPIQDTPAPKGFKPFYISHYGRHGSRYEQNASFSAAALEGFEKAKDADILSQKGQALYDQVKKITDEHKGNEGALSPRGGREHQMLAERMYSRFTPVFNSKKPVNVRVLGSTSPRSLVSMANFTSSLKGLSPNIVYSITSADQYMHFMGPSFNYQGLIAKAYGGVMPAATGHNLSATPGNTYDFSRLYSVIFSDSAKAKEVITDMDAFVRAIYSTGSLCEDLDYLGYDIFRDYFTTEELVYLFQNQNDMIYLFWGNSIEGGDDVRQIIKPLLKDILTKADDAIATGNTVADLRFGHDTGALPLFSLLGIDDQNNERHSFRSAHEKWFGGLRIPMATNFQMVFYKNKKGDIIVKFLHNEKEATLKGLPTVSGPYYDWGVLKTHLESLCI